MSHVILQRTMDLSPRSIDEISEQLEETLSAASISMDRRMQLRIRLSIEEVLLRWRDALGEQAICTLIIKKRMGIPQINLSVSGERVDPREASAEYSADEQAVQKSLLTMLGLTPQYEYTNGTNTLLFRLSKKKKNPVVTLLLLIAAAIICGIAGQYAPEGLKAFLTNDLVEPVFSAFLRILSTLAGPMMFLSVVWGVYNIGDTALLGRIGGKMVRRFIAALFLISLIAILLNIGLYSVQMIPSVSGENSAFGDILRLLLSIIPSNIVEPFYTGNAMQIVFCSLCIGVAMLALSHKTTVLAQMIEQTNYVVQLIMDVIAELVPVFIFCSVLSFTLSGDLMVLASTLRFLIYFAVTLLVLCFLFCISLGFRHHISPFKLIRKVNATLVIAITTASSAAAFLTNLEDCKKRLGIDSRLVNLGIPLGQVLFKVGDATLSIVIALFMADLYGIPISVQFLLITLIIAPILSIASPTIPGGSLTVFTILFNQLGIPLEAVALATVINTIVDFPVTAANLFCLQMELGVIAGNLNMLDEKKMVDDVSASHC